MSFISKYKKLISTISGFSVVGVVVTLVSMLLIFVFNEILCWNSIVSYLISYTLSILLSYFLNTVCVWKKDASMVDLFHYFGIYIASMVIGAVLLWVLELVSPSANKTILSYFVIPFTMIWNYFFVNRLLSK